VTVLAAGDCAENDVYESEHLRGLRLDLAAFWQDVGETLDRIPRS